MPKKVFFFFFSLHLLGGRRGFSFMRSAPPISWYAVMNPIKIKLVAFKNHEILSV